MQDIDVKDNNVTDLEVYAVGIEVISAHGLKKADIASESDPYVKITIGNQTAKTNVVQNDANPKWEKAFNFQFFENPKSVRFEVFDEDTTGDDLLGAYEFDLTDFFKLNLPTKPFFGNLNLAKDLKKQPKKNEKKDRGTLKVRIMGKKFSPFTLEKLTESQRETIGKQNQQINHLTDSNETLRTENESLKQKVTELRKQMPEDASNQKNRASESPGQSQGKYNLNYKQPGELMNAAMVNLRGKKNEGLGFLEELFYKVFSIWQWILRKCIYEFPLIGYYADLFILFIGSLLRLEVGYNVFNGASSSKRPPNKYLKLYEFEGCIQCKMVRETLCALDLDCIIYPCPAPDDHLSRFRDEAKRVSGSGQLPVLVDENYGDNGPLVLINSEQIVRYLYDEYGNNVKRSVFEKIRYWIANHKLAVLVYKWLYLKLLRCLPEQGNERYCNTVKPNNLLELWSYEASPFCVKVRETMTCLELPYILKNVAIGSKQKRQEFQIRFGRRYPQWRQKLHLIQVPLLIDPNLEKELFESEEIKKYLVHTYCT